VEIHAVRTRGLTHVLTDTLKIEPGADLEARYGIIREPDLETALAGKPDAVFVTNPSSLHVPVALAAAEAGAHLFIEKPLSDDLDDVARLVATVERRALVALVGYQLRFHPCWRTVKTLLDAQAVGTLLAVRFEVGEYLPGWHTYEDYRQMYASRRDLGGGVILSQIHELDLVYWLFGMPRKVFALGGHWSGLQIDVEDTASILLECPHGGRSLQVHVQLDYVQRPPSRRCEVVGEAGKIVVDLHVPEVRVVAADGHVAIHGVTDFKRNDLFLDELRHFLACVGGGARPVVSARDGARSLEIALAAHRSIATGAAVELA
jgi:predicted dehydrogenase